MNLLWWAIVLAVAASLTGGFLLARRRKGPDARIFEAGPWTGMRDSTDAADASPDKAKLIKNMVPLATEAGRAWISRPGYEVAAASLGSKGQGLFQWDFAAGAGVYRIAVYSGEVWSVSASTQTATKVIATADLTGKSITLSATARVSFAVLGGKIIVSDGVNTPFAWNPTLTLPTSLTKLTNAPVFYGPLTVYYSKLFGIKNTDRTTIVWSEENDPTIGYEAGGYNDAWTFNQQNQADITALLGTNEALFVFRARSITEITGAVNSDFQTSGTRAAVSETIGTKSPWSVIFSRRAVFFLDEVGRPHYFRLSGEVVPIWKDFRVTVADNVVASLVDAIAIDHAPLGLVCFGLTVNNGQYPSRWLNYVIESDGSPVAAGYFDGYTFTAAIIWADMTPFSASPPRYTARMAHLGPTDGKCYIHYIPGDQVSSLVDVATPISCEFQTQDLGADISGELYFDRVDWELYNSSTTQAPSYYYVTQRGTSTPVTPTAVGIGSVHQSLGVNAHSRWIRLGTTHATSGKLFGVTRARVRGVATTEAPTNP